MDYILAQRVPMHRMPRCNCPSPPTPCSLARKVIDHRKSMLAKGLYTPTILGGNSYLSWFHDRGTIKDPAHTGTSKALSQAIDRGPIRKFLPKYANVYVTIQSHGLSTGARTHYVAANGVRNGLIATHPMQPGASGDGGVEGSDTELLLSTCKDSIPPGSNPLSGLGSDRGVVFC